MYEVRRLRLEKEWNQNELAFHADLAPSVISQIETGKREPSATTLRKLADALGVDIPDLFSPKAPAPTSPQPAAEAPGEERHAVGKSLTLRWNVEAAAHEIVDLALESAARGEDITTIKTAAARRLEEHLVA
jgi:transcriptional regulator with XRE-family HTH domain